LAPTIDYPTVVFVVLVRFGRVIGDTLFLAGRRWICPCRTRMIVGGVGVMLAWGKGIRSTTLFQGVVAASHDTVADPILPGGQRVSSIASGYPR
jgi:hypothetical protein